MGKTVLAKALARSLELRVLAAPVHARPAAGGRDRRQRLRPGSGRVPLPARPGVRERAARRRDQPRVAEDAVRAARGDAGDPGDGRRRRRYAARAAVPRHRDPEPGRVRGDVPAARGAARPLRGADGDRLPAARRRGAHARRADDRAAARPARAGRERAELLAAIEAARAGLRRGERHPLRRHAPPAHAGEPRLALGASPRCGHRAASAREGARAVEGRGVRRPGGRPARSPCPCSRTD